MGGISNWAREDLKSSKERFKFNPTLRVHCSNRWHSAVIWLVRRRTRSWTCSGSARRTTTLSTSQPSMLEKEEYRTVYLIFVRVQSSSTLNSSWTYTQKCRKKLIVILKYLYTFEAVRGIHNNSTAYSNAGVYIFPKNPILPPPTYEMIFFPKYLGTVQVGGKSFIPLK